MTGGTLWAHAWRTGVVVVLLAVAGLGTFLSGLGGRPLGTLWSALALGAGAALVARLLWHRRPGRLAAPVAALLVAGALGVSIGVRTPPGPVVLGNAIEALDLPDGEVVETRSGGNVLCFDVCPYAERVFVVPGEPEEVADQVRRALRDAGYELEDPVDARSFTTAHDGDREWHVSGRAEPAPGGQGTRLEVDASA